VNLRLKRTDYLPAGIFSDLRDSIGARVCYALEHSYVFDSGANWLPKLTPGTYVCERGQHVLGSGPIETFEVKGVQGHAGILIHPGNTEVDSHGCILLGTTRQLDKSRSPIAVLDSRLAFKKFMELQAGLNSFSLTVEL
jgi:hypothetical protein